MSPAAPRQANAQAPRTEAAPARPARLYVLGPSHFCERARWGLDHAGIGYEEERWTPGPHRWMARRLGLPSSATPVLLLGHGRIVQGSGAILDHAGTPGGDPELERRFVEHLGPLIRQLLYAAALNDPGSGVRDALLEGVSPGQARAGRLLWPATRLLLIAGLQARRGLVPSLLARTGEELAWFEGVLANRGPHLAGRGFGRADLTAASLLAPLAIPPECPVASLYAGVRLPPEVERAIDAWRSGPALTWTRAIYAAHRRPRLPGQATAPLRTGREEGGSHG
jgi:glutathione S-transferase